MLYCKLLKNDYWSLESIEPIIDWFMGLKSAEFNLGSYPNLFILNVLPLSAGEKAELPEKPIGYGLSSVYF